MSNAGVKFQPTVSGHKGVVEKTLLVYAFRVMNNIAGSRVGHVPCGVMWGGGTVCAIGLVPEIKLD